MSTAVIFAQCTLIVSSSCFIAAQQSGAKSKIPLKFTATLPPLLKTLPANLRRISQSRGATSWLFLPTQRMTR
jgi:hypothetical protein